MRRILFIHLPRFAIENFRRSRQYPAARQGEAVALVESGAKGLHVAAVNMTAAQKGVRSGQALTDARAICPGLMTFPADPQGDRAALLALARWCDRYSPYVAPVFPDGIVLDITGCAHLFGGEAGLVRDAVARLRDIGFSAHPGLADTPGAAAAIAGWSGARDIAGRILPEGGIAAGVAALPVEALRLSAETCLLLRRLGLKTIGQLAAIPRAALARRFRSPETAEDVQRRLDQLSGSQAEPIEPLRAPAACRAHLNFAEPLLDALAIADILDHLLVKVTCGLEAAGKGARALTLSACRTDGTTAGLEVRLSRPSRSVPHIRRLFAERLEQIDPGFGIDALILTVDAAQVLAAVAETLDNTLDRQSEGVAVLVDRLMNRLGPERIWRAEPVGSHLPERAERFVPAAAAAMAEPVSHRYPAPRPFRLLDEPEEITATAEVPDGPPRQFVWRRVNRRVVRATGPERIGPEWWRLDEPGAERDYYAVEDTEGRRYWLFRAGLYRESTQVMPRWFMHGLFA
jgi:protein ImuB